MELWIAGIAISVIFSLIGIIWRSTQKQNDLQDIRIDNMEQNQNSIAQQVTNCKAVIEGIKENCARHHKSDMAENDIRNMFREELKQFEARIKQEIISIMKLTLIEEGYITPNQNQNQNKQPRKRNNVAKV